MRIAIVYHSGSGNTKALAEEIAVGIPGSELIRIQDFNLETLPEYDALVIGTYTWANGDIPKKIQPLYEAIEDMDVSHLSTAVFGTGETGYLYFCGAVDSFRDMLNVHTNLLVTLKIEQRFQDADLVKIQKFCEIVTNKLIKG